MHIATNKWEALGLAYDYEYNKHLVLVLDVYVDFSVDALGIPISLSTSMTNVEENINAPSDRANCKCPANPSRVRRNNTANFITLKGMPKKMLPLATLRDVN